MNSNGMILKWWGVLSFMVLLINQTLLSADFSTRSARLDALQLNVSVEDETNTIGLKKWADNVAGNLIDEDRSRIVPVYGYFNQDHDSGGANTHSNEGGVYGVLKRERSAFGFQLDGEHNVDPNYAYRDLNTKNGLLYLNHQFGKVLMGVQSSYSTEQRGLGGNVNTETRTNPLSYELGLGYELMSGDNQLVFGLDYERVDTRVTSTGNPSLDSRNNVFGAQATGAINKNLKFGLSYKDDQYKADQFGSETRTKDYRARGFFDPENTPLQFGAEASFGTQNFPNDDFETYDLNSGMAIKTLNNLLVGFEHLYSHSRDNSLFSTIKNSSNKYTVGAEFIIFRNLMTRLSGSYQDSGSKDLTRAYGIGLGKNLTARTKIDLSYLRSGFRSQTKKIDYDEVNLIGNFYF